MDNPRNRYRTYSTISVIVVILVGLLELLNWVRWGVSCSMSLLAQIIGLLRMRIEVNQRLLNVLLLWEQLLRFLLLLLIWLNVEKLGLLNLRMGIKRYRRGWWMVQAQWRPESSWLSPHKEACRPSVGHLRHRLGGNLQMRVRFDDLFHGLGFLQREHRPRVSWSRLRPVSPSRPRSQYVTV